MSDNLDVVAAELAAARRQLRAARRTAAGFIKGRAVQGDLLAGYIDELLDAADDRLTAANIFATTELSDPPL